jgi:hypothetical protein
MSRACSCQFALLGLLGLAVPGCGGSAKPAAPAPAAASVAPAEAASSETIPGRPAGWDAANRTSAEHFQAGRYAEAIAVLEAFAKAHPRFADVELMLGDNWATMPRTATPSPSERRARAAVHLRRGLQLATDDYGRDWGTRSLLRVYQDQVFDHESLTAAARQQLVAEASPFVEDLLRKDPGNDDALRLKSRLAEIGAQAKTPPGDRK